MLYDNAFGDMSNALQVIDDSLLGKFGLANTEREEEFIAINVRGRY